MNWWGRMLALIGAVAAPVFAQELAPVISVRAETLAIVHARVIDGRGREPREDQTVIVHRGRIASMGDSASVQPPEGATILDATGKTLLPGFVMVHEHMFFTSRASRTAPFHVNEMEYSFPRLYLACGLTTIRTGGCVEPYTDLQIRHRIGNGTLPGPKLHLTAPYIEGFPSAIPQLHFVDSPEAARRLVHYWADEGFTSFKLYTHLSRELARAAIAAAHERGLKVSGHLGALTYREAADLGIDNLEHGFFAASDFVRGKLPDVLPNPGAMQSSILELDLDSPAVEALIRHLVDKGVALTSTLPVFEAGVPGRPKLSPRELEAFADHARENYLWTWERINATNDQRAPALFAKMMALERKFFAAGGLLVAGSDPTGHGAVIAGHGSLREIELLVEAGLTPVQAIQVASFHGARLLGVADEVGSIERGKAADLVLVAGNPARAIGEIRQIEIVFKDGVGFDAARLLEAVKGCVGIQ